MIHGLGRVYRAVSGGENGERRGFSGEPQPYAITAIGKLKNDPGLVLTRREKNIPANSAGGVGKADNCSLSRLPLTAVCSARPEVSEVCIDFAGMHCLLGVRRACV